MTEWLLASLTAATKASKAVTDNLGGLQIPSPQDVLDMLDRLPVYQGAILLIAGLVYMLWGWKIFKILVTVNLAAVGAYLGSVLGAMHSEQWSMYGTLIGAVVLAIVAWPLMKFSVSLMGAAAGAFAGYYLWVYFTNLYRPDLTHAQPVAGVDAACVAAFVGMLLVGAMAFVLFRTVIMLFTSLQVAVLAVAGGVALAMKYEPAHKEVRLHLLNDPHLLPLLVIVPTLVGFLYQALALARRKPAPAAAPSSSP